MNSEMRRSLDGLIQWYESLCLENVGEVGRYYAIKAHFIDPFNDVLGVPAIEHIFRHMFTQVDAPRFRITDRTEGEDVAVLVWVFSFRSHGRERAITGTSVLRFDEACRVIEHRDFWDPARELYGDIPLLGAILRWIARRLSAVGH